MSTKAGIVLAVVGVLALLAAIFVVGLGRQALVPGAPAAFSSELQQSSPTEAPRSSPPPTAPREPVYTAAEAWKHIGEYATVEYAVANPFRSSKGNTFLNEKMDYRRGFTTVIFANTRSRWPQDPVTLYGRKRICVTGMIKTYEGHPEIIADDPAQIQISEEAGGAGANGNPVL